MYVRAGRPAFARPCVGVHKSSFNSFGILETIYFNIHKYANRRYRLPLDVCLCVFVYEGHSIDLFFKSTVLLGECIWH